MAELLEAGLTLTLIGMSVVFVLLTLLVGAVHLMTRFCRLFDGATAAADPAPAAIGPADEELAGVAAAAIRMFRRDRAARGTG